MTTSIEPARPRLRGKARMIEIAAENEIERQKIEADLLSSLGRVPSPIDRMAAESLSAAMVRARRLRAIGRDDREERKLIAQLIRASGFKPDAPTPKSESTLADLAATWRGRAEVAR